MKRLTLIVQALAVLTALTIEANRKAGIVVSIDRATALAGQTVLLGIYASSDSGDVVSDFNLPFDYNSDGFVDVQNDGIGDFPNGFSLAPSPISGVVYFSTGLDRPLPQIRLIGVDAIAAGTGADIILGNSLNPTKLFNVVVQVAPDVAIGTVLPFQIKLPNAPFASLFNVAGPNTPTVFLPSPGIPATGSITIVAVPEPTSIFLLLSLVISMAVAMPFQSRRSGEYEHKHCPSN